MQDSELNSLLHKALTSKSLSDANETLNKVKSFLKSSPPGDSITSSTLLDLKSILNTFGFQLCLKTAKLYKVVLQAIPKSNKSLLIQLSKDINELCKLIHGTDISYILEQLIEQESRSMLLEPLIPKEDHTFLKSLIEKSQPFFSETQLEYIVNDLKENNPFGMSRLMDCFCGMNSIRDQFFYFSILMQPVVVTLEQNLESEEGIDREILLKLLEILEHFVFKYNFNIQLSKYDPASPMYAQPFTIVEYKLIRIYSQNFEIFVSIINLLRTGDILITQNLIRILHRLWNIYKDSRTQLYDLIYTNLKEVAVGGTEESKLNASYLLIDILESKETSPEFKNKLESEKMLNILFKNTDTEEIFELGEEVELENLQILVGFPLSSTIPSGGSWTHLVEIPESKCVLSWGFATENYDVSFSLVRVDLPEPEVLISHYKVRCDETPYTGIRLLNSAGLYKFTWSNSYSWFRAKHLRYKIFVLRPYKKNFNSVNLELNKIINIVADDDVGDSCFTEELDFLEIGVQVNEKKIRLLCLDPNSSEGKYICEEVSYKETSEIILQISDFIGDILKDTSKDRRFASIKVGIVMQTPEVLPGLEELSSIAIAKDVHAIGLLSQDSLHSHTIIVVMNEDGLRSCIVHRGRVLCDENGEGLGNLKNLPDMEIYQKIAILLCNFGPAAVILVGEGFDGNLAGITAKIKQWVPGHIWSKSFIRESVFKQAAAAQAAAKLNYLHFKYNFFM